MSQAENGENFGGDRLLRKKEAAEILACSERHIDRLVDADKLTRVKILGATRFRNSEVQTLMNGEIYAK